MYSEYTWSCSLEVKLSCIDILLISRLSQKHPAMSKMWNTENFQWVINKVKIHFSTWIDRRNLP